MKNHLRIGTRGSALALAQAAWVQQQIQGRYPQITVDLEIIKTTGDKIQDVALAKIGGKGLFTKEIEMAILSGEVDLGVHSMKDVPTEIPLGLVIGITTVREDPRDAFISRKYRSLAEIPLGGRIGTGSLRRRAQLLHLRPDLEIVPLRGNVDTRLRKLTEADLDAIILAAAGLHRLGRAAEITAILPETQMLPAIGQGALGLEYRQDDAVTMELLEFLDDPETRVAVAAERAFLARLEGGCQVPIAAMGTLKKGELFLDGLIGDLAGSRIYREQLSRPPAAAADLGQQLAETLLKRGGAQILSEVYGRVFD
ncbi:hydroxymethylbilane synthase [Desulfobacca acetoxidans]|uniref:Porphobilinogen deaminase n=1 Tax=Desulfobacca acetoxidans (strain ATCC 700848 / DSM 11109 / ASRB2) TaxID=880072 RepID=F2NEV4_DESAR|nr:hydroxymethylbilane synthase [Desulfobacca acetoxidans]AEB08294.1 Porphobilinogen deaminase [Desulfobacca acetoxidans DSM 11109]